MSVLISIITPCFNKGQYINEALESVNTINTSYSFEHIIVNDGSTDERTITELNNLQAKGYHVIHQENMGPAAARNTALAVSKGKYILPLDSDNKLSDTYLTTAIDILEREKEIDVIYGNSLFFGNENYYNKIHEFNIYKILEENYIDTCAVIRKSMLEKVNGYDIKINRGHEDWELWVNIFFNGGKFYYLDELCFYYRVTDNSLRLSVSPKSIENRQYIIKKQADNLLAFFKDNYWRMEYLKKNRLKGSLSILLNKLF